MMMIPNSTLETYKEDCCLDPAYNTSAINSLAVVEASVSSYRSRRLDSISFLFFYLTFAYASVVAFIT